MSISLEESNKYSYPSHIVVINQVIWFRIFLREDRYHLMTATVADDDKRYSIKKYDCAEMLKVISLLQQDLFGNEVGIDDFLKHDSGGRPYYSLLDFDNLQEHIQEIFNVIEKKYLCI